MPVSEEAVATEIDLAVEVDIHAMLPCEGIWYRKSEEPASPGWQSPCPNIGEWTRTGHCSRDSTYCTNCKERLTIWSQYGWVRCHDCGTIIGPDQLHWRKL